jgi:hypothetical protein
LKDCPASRRLLREPKKRWQNQRGQDGKGDNDNRQFNQREGAFARASIFDSRIRFIGIGFHSRSPPVYMRSFCFVFPSRLPVVLAILSPSHIPMPACQSSKFMS